MAQNPDLKVAELATTARRSAFRAAALPMTAAVAALSTWVVNYQFSQAVPVIELASITFEPTDQRDTMFKPSLELDQLRTDSGLTTLRGFSVADAVSLRSARDWPGEIERQKGLLATTSKAFDKAIALVSPERAELAPADLRQQLLGLDKDTRGQFSAMIYAVIDGERLRRLLTSDVRWAKYEQHPPDFSPADALVSREGQPAADLSEVQPGSGVSEATRARVNLYRRLFAYADRYDLRVVFELCRAEAEKRAETLSRLQGKLLAELEASNPRRVRATMVVQNFGLASAMFRDAGVLVLDPEGRNLSRIEMVRADSDGSPDPSGAFVVEGGQSMTVDYYSNDPVAAIDPPNVEALIRSHPKGRGAMVLERLRRTRSDEPITSSALALGQSAYVAAWGRLAKVDPPSIQRARKDSQEKK